MSKKITKKQTLIELAEIVKSVSESNLKTLSEIKENLVNFNKFLLINEKTVEKVAEYEENMNHVVKIIQVAEEQICNCMLAIKQNSCYKPWYPESYKESE